MRPKNATEHSLRPYEKVSLADELRDQANHLIEKAHELLNLALRADGRGDQNEHLFLLDPPTRVDPTLLEIAREIYRSRRLRTQVFGSEELFGEPAWDMLLDLFIAACESKRVQVTSACIGANVPTTTALRWIAILEDKGLLLRENDSIDARRVFVRLSDNGFAHMSTVIAKMRLFKSTSNRFGEAQALHTNAE